MQIVRPEDSEYESARQCFNLRIDAFPAAIIFCQTEQDVIEAVKMAGDDNKEIKVRSGGHSYEGYCLGGKESYVIDISGIKAVTAVNCDSGMAAWIGAGATLYKDVYRPLYDRFKMTIPAGSCPTVGLGGLATSGGFSFSTCYLGLTCDSILAIRIVTADGKLRVITSQQDSALFWACCGAGGGNFGVITSFLIKLYTAETVAIYKLCWQWTESDVSAVAQRWFEFIGGCPSELTSFLRFGSMGEHNVLTAFGQYYGSQLELENIVEKAFDGLAKVSVVFDTLSNIDAIRHWAGLDNKNSLVHMNYDYAYKTHNRRFFKAGSVMLDRPLHSDEITKLFSLINSAFDGSFIVFDSHQNGRSSQLPLNYNAYVHRKAICSGQIYSAWQRRLDEPSRIKWVEDVYDLLASASHGAYYNYCDSNLIDYGNAYYGCHFEKLKKIKAKYDPDNRFRYDQSIPPA